MEGTLRHLTANSTSAACGVLGSSSMSLTIIVGAVAFLLGALCMALAVYVARAKPKPTTDRVVPVPVTPRKLSPAGARILQGRDAIDDQRDNSSVEVREPVGVRPPSRHESRDTRPPSRHSRTGSLETPVPRSGSPGIPRTLPSTSSRPGTSGAQTPSPNQRRPSHLRRSTTENAKVAAEAQASAEARSSGRRHSSKVRPQGVTTQDAPRRRVLLPTLDLAQEAASSPNYYSPDTLPPPSRMLQEYDSMMQGGDATFPPLSAFRQPSREGPSAGTAAGPFTYYAGFQSSPTPAMIAAMKALSGGLSEGYTGSPGDLTATASPRLTHMSSQRGDIGSMTYPGQNGGLPATFPLPEGVRSPNGLVSTMFTVGLGPYVSPHAPAPAPAHGGRLPPLAPFSLTHTRTGSGGGGSVPSGAGMLTPASAAFLSSTSTDNS